MGYDTAVIAAVAEALAAEGIHVDVGAHENIPYVDGTMVITIVGIGAVAGDSRDSARAADDATLVNGTLSIAARFGRHGVRANCIVHAIPAPGTEQAIRNSTLLPRVCQVDDVISTAIFLASDDASFVTGQIVRVVGGLFSHIPHYAYMMSTGSTTTKS